MQVVLGSAGSKASLDEILSQSLLDEIEIVDAGGNAAWRRDGALQQTAPSFPLNKNFSIKVISPGSTDTMLGSGHIDNVLVTTP